MTERPVYTEFHPKWYRTHISSYWWLGRWPYVKFILRELSSVFVAYFVVITLLQIRTLAQDPQAYQALQDRLQTPIMVVLNIISLLFVLLHTITWFNLTPKAMVLHMRGKRIPDVLIAAPNYVAWLVVSGIIAWIVTGG
jgi:fumarate reductase subunit C